MQQPAPKKRSWNPLLLILGLSALFFVVFVALSGVIFLRSPSKGGASSGRAALFGGGSVGVIELNGVITDSRRFIKQLERLEDDSSIKAIVLRLNSPGGSVAPSQEIYEAVKACKKPVVSSMASVAASGAFYVAMGTRKIYANPGTITGSIGVIMEFANLEKLYEWAKIKRFAIKTGKFKDAGAEYREMSAEERALLQGMVDNVLGQFKQAVAQGRKLSLEQVTQVADGRIFSGAQAKASKLVDELGTLQDAINEAGRLAQIKGRPQVVYPERSRKRLLDFLMDDRGGDDPEESRSALGGLEGLVQRVLGASSGAAGLSRLEDRITGLSPGIYWIWEGAR